MPSFASTTSPAPTPERQEPALVRAEPWRISKPVARARRKVDELLLPTLRERVRECLWFLALSQGIYVVTLLFSQGEGYVLRGALNVFRLVVLSGCIYALRGEGTRRQSLGIFSIGMFTQISVGVAISAVRKDVFPMALLTTGLTYVSAALIPYGARAQAMLAAGAAVGIFLAAAAIYSSTGQMLAFDPAATLLTGLAISVYIAHSLDRSRTIMQQRLDDARRTDEELAGMQDQLEKRVAERTAELEMANRELESFSYTVSHDLRSPLRTIAGFSQMILDERGEDMDETTHAHLGKIRAASRRMDGLIDDMLRLSRVSRGALRYETIDLATVARGVAAELQAEDPARDVQFAIGEVPELAGDLALLRIAMENLLRNAWKFTGTRQIAHIAVRGTKVDDHVVVTVEDDGIGFDPRFRNKLFHPFERIHDGKQFPGSGVGLATVARIVRRHGGSVDADGTIGAGAKFSMRLPVSRPA